MGKYTHLDDPRVDAYIDERLKTIVNSFVQGAPGIRSILLTGSYGRGEGSAIVTATGVTLLRDFDLVLLFHKRVPRKEVASISDRLERMFCPPRDASYHYMDDFSLDVKPSTLARANLLPDMGLYDMRFCPVLYGEDIRLLINCRLEDIPLRSGARGLISKGIAMAGSMHVDYLRSGVPSDLRANFLRETSRAYFVAAEALTLLLGCYDHRAWRRLALLEERRSQELAGLLKKVPDLLDKIERAIRFKLDPAHNPINDDPIAYWFTTRDDLGEIWRFFFAKYLGTEAQDWDSFSQQLERSLGRQYYLPLIETGLRTRRIPYNNSLLRILNYAWGLGYNGQYAWKQFRIQGRLVWPWSNGYYTPGVEVFVTVPLLLFGLNRDGSIISRYIDTVERKLQFAQVEQQQPHSWERARSRLMWAVFSASFF